MGHFDGGVVVGCRLLLLLEISSRRSWGCVLIVVLRGGVVELDFAEDLVDDVGGGGRVGAEEGSDFVGGGEVGGVGVGDGEELGGNVRDVGDEGRFVEAEVVDEGHVEVDVGEGAEGVEVRRGAFLGGAAAEEVREDFFQADAEEFPEGEGEGDEPEGPVGPVGDDLGVGEAFAPRQVAVEEAREAVDGAIIGVWVEVLVVVDRRVGSPI
mmetsp:Transcript_24480/g.79069  ORF Transcript_24480/g.79069 Transcript_24480/m.79069 type:complete len:210 (+) Transcript_24480:1121-1750(+)